MQKITATKTRKGAKTLYHVYVNGVLRDGYPMTSKVHDYEYVNVQRWHGINEDIDGDDFAARFSRKPKAIGAKIEYGYNAENVRIEEVA